MKKCELHITNDNYEMFDGAYLIEDNRKTELYSYCNIGNWQDSVIVYKQADLGDIEDDFCRYYLHGYHNQEVNNIIFYGVYVDELIIHNETEKLLVINKKYRIKIGDKFIISK